MPGADIYLLDADDGADAVIRDPDALVYLAESNKPYSGDYQASRLIAEGNVTVQIDGEAAFDEIAAKGDIAFSGGGALYVGEEAGTVEKIGVKRTNDRTL